MSTSRSNCLRMQFWKDAVSLSRDRREDCLYGKQNILKKRKDLPSWVSGITLFCMISLHYFLLVQQHEEL